MTRDVVDLGKYPDNSTFYDVKNKKVISKMKARNENDTKKTSLIRNI